MSILAALLITSFVLIIVLVVISMFRNVNDFGDDEVTTTTTTTTITNDWGDQRPSYIIHGNLSRSYDNGQPYVIDPVDGDKVWLNTSDDMYEDLDGKIWKLK